MSHLVVKANDLIAFDTYKMILINALPHRPGQFIEIKVSDTMTPYLRRPLSVADYKNGELTLVYKVVGLGTKILSTVKPQSSLDVIEQLGNGFNLDTVEKNITLIGGGCGCVPLLFLAKELRLRRKTIKFIAGFQSSKDCFFVDEFSQLGAVKVITDDGTLGTQGNVITAMNHIIESYYYAVGPKSMLQAIATISKWGQMSLEERMGCGFGACMGCSIMTSQGIKRVCVDGPVFNTEDIIW
ncbi:MAG: dihydroorotate dehydrogenase electron transfer subunit [Candidatus Izemoplasmatales bacterium]|nr:dihydroorotate dehydrogenase electron transfer subunit [Candidatus Izemoplasmatales bacterium]MDD3865101.1 dihydroorotate dehydrogenase electron transfer subunit [Candidatus Izemoplasmatales bacterium]